MKTSLTILLLAVTSVAFGQYWNQDGNNIFNTNTGTVGIGTTSPYSQSRLHVKSLYANAWGFLVEASGNDKVTSFGHDGTNGYISTSYLNTGGYSPLHLRTQNLTRIAIDVDGNVGVGTASPEHLLQITNQNNPTLAIGKLNTNTNGKATLAFYAGNATNQNGFLLHYFKDATTDRLAFLDGGNVEVLTVKHGGNVGIGTSDPDAKLAVKGVIHTQEVRVDLQGSMVPDYVFEENYTLPTLGEIESYIKQNKHLPEVPSAKEMEASGMHLKEMNLLLLKKVEELTLYVIELKKQSEIQQNEIQFLKKCITK